MNRIKKLSMALPEGADAALITSDVNRRYFTGLGSSAGTLLAFRDAAYFIIDFRYIEVAKATVTGARVMLQEKLEALLGKAPDWWGTGDKERYDNLIFVMPPAAAQSISEKIGEPTKELEQISICENSIFWSFDRKKYAKATWWNKTASPGIGEFITIRTANTLRKIAVL